MPNDGSWIPDTRQRIQRATKFFARMESFALECPHCGRVYSFKMGVKDRSWDPRTARFTCNGRGGCSKIYVLGILAWPVANVPKVASQTPEDQVPSPRQLSQLRREGQGYWLEDDAAIKARRPDTNLTTEQDRPERDDEDEEE